MKEYDKYGRIEPGIIYLATATKKILCAVDGVDYTTVSLRRNYNNTHELSFDVSRFVDGEESLCYEWLEEMMYLHLDGIWFEINVAPSVDNDGLKEIKHVEAESAEIILQHFDLVHFKINQGTADSYEVMYKDKIGSKDYFQVKFYNPENEDLSLVHLILKHANVPLWKIGYVDDVTPNENDGNVFLKDEVYGFEIDSMDVYSFLTQDVAKAFRTIVIFDTEEMTINFYRVETYGKDTNVYLGFHNVENSVEISREEELYTAYTVFGKDDLNIDYVNFGTSEIYDISYFMKEPYMKPDLIEKLKAYLDYKESQRPEYIDLSKQYNNYLNVIDDLRYRVPDDSMENDWFRTPVEKLKQAYNDYVAIIQGLEDLYVDDDGNFDLNKLKESDDWLLYSNIMNYTLPKIVAALQSNGEDLEDYGTGNLLRNVNPAILDEAWEIYNTDETLETYEITDSPAYGLVRGIKADLPSLGTGNKFGIIQRKTAVTMGENYTLSVYIKPLANVNTVYLEYGTADDDRTSKSFRVNPNEWVRVSHTFKAESKLVDVAFVAEAGAVGASIQFAGMQLEHGDAATSFGYYIQDENILYAFETNWDLYGTVELEIKLQTYKDAMDILKKSNFDQEWEEYSDYDEEYHRAMHQKYLDYKKLYDECNVALTERKADLEKAEAHLKDLQDKRGQIAKNVLEENFGEVQDVFDGFTEDELSLIRIYQKHTDYENENILTTSISAEDEVVDTQYKLYLDALESLYVDAHPQYTYTDDVENIYALEEFKDFHEELNIGHFLRIATRHDEFVKLRAVAIEYNPCMYNASMIIEFSNMIQFKSKRNDFNSLIESAIRSRKNNPQAGISGSNDVTSYIITADVIKALLKNPSFNGAVGGIGGGGGYIGNIENLVVNALMADKVQAEVVNAVTGNFHEIFTDYIAGELASFKQTVTDFLMAGEIITEDIHAATGNFTNYLTGVKIMGDIIEANTIVADKIILRGSEESLVYELNQLGQLTEEQLAPGEVEKYQIDGKIIVAESITSTEINVDDLWVTGIANMLNANINKALINDLTALTSHLGSWYFEGSTITGTYDSTIIGGNLQSKNYREDPDTGTAIEGLYLDMNNFVLKSRDFNIDQNGNVSIAGRITVKEGSKVPSSVINVGDKPLDEVLNGLGGIIELQADRQIFIQKQAMISPDSITVKATGTIKVARWYIDDVEHTLWVSEDKQSIVIPSAFMADKESIAIKAENYDGTAEDTLSLYKLVEGSSSISVVLSSSNGQVFHDETEILTTLITAEVYRGTELIEADSYQFSQKSDSGDEWIPIGTTYSSTIELAGFVERSRIRCIVGIA